MSPAQPLSLEEEIAIAQLGGLERVVEETDAILRRHGISRSLFPRKATGPGSTAENICRGPITLRFRSDISVRANLDDLLNQVKELQAHAGGTAYVGAMLQHLVGAKLDVVMGPEVVVHHGHSVADHSTERQADFALNDVAIHVTTHPTEALVRKCESNLQAGLKPLIVTLDEGVAGAVFLLKGAGLASRVDVLDAGQFLTANIYERSAFQSSGRKETLIALLTRYNEIVSKCETDPSLRIQLNPAGLRR